MIKRKLTLEQRVARLERRIERVIKNESTKADPYKVIYAVIKEIKNGPLAEYIPNPNKPDCTNNPLDGSYRIKFNAPRLVISNDEYESIVDDELDRIANLIKSQFNLYKTKKFNGWPGEPAIDFWIEPDRSDSKYYADDEDDFDYGYGDDDEWESPEFQDARRNAAWDKERRNHPWNYR